MRAKKIAGMARSHRYSTHVRVPHFAVIAS